LNEGKNTTRERDRATKVGERERERERKTDEKQGDEGKERKT